MSSTEFCACGAAKILSADNKTFVCVNPHCLVSPQRRVDAEQPQRITTLYAVILREDKALFVTDAGLLELRVEPSALVAMMEQAGRAVGEIIAQRPVDAV